MSFSGFGKDQFTPASGFAAMQGASNSKTFVPGKTLNYGSGHVGKRRAMTEEEYFNDDEEGEENDSYQKGPDSPGVASDDSDDPLDAFMAGIEKEIVKETKEKISTVEEKLKEKGTRDDIDNEDVQESYFRYMEENPNAGVINEEDDLVDYDSDGNPIMQRKKIIDPLPPIDHSEMSYEAFERNFYVPHKDIESLTADQVEELRHKLGIKVSGLSPPHPVSSFAHFGFDEALLGAIRKSEYTQPTPIQAQGIPVALSGRDMIGIAKTGSGKTAAFLWPMLVHIMDQRELQKGEGPIGLILAPTRELSQQIYHECKKFGKVYNINVVCAYGGGSMWEQSKACQEGAEIIVATPGRLIDLVKKKVTNLTRVTYLVYDEADRMFDMGFEAQVRSIADHVRPDRQTLLFSATFRKRVEKLARDILADPVRVVQGEVGEANEDVTQIVEVLPLGPAKWTWLMRRLVGFTSEGSVLIFVTRKTNSEELAANLKAKDFELGLLHGDISQAERNEIISAFKKREFSILVATDVAARGLDIPHIKTVVNYDVARDIDTHTHRVGRTGRAGSKGYAYTLITEKDKEFAPHLVRNLEGANQHVPPALLDLAQKCPWFKKNRYKGGKGKVISGRGLGCKERPGLGSENSSTVQDATSFSSFRASTSIGPQSDRLSAMKSAFYAQFKSNFVSAVEQDRSSSEENYAAAGGASQLNSSLQPQMIQPSGIGGASRMGLGSEGSAKKKKRSRWD
ncbi:ATP-dependent RNA helicase DDX42 [Biomphalaria glabrata]|uniref:ATP-dependent RNA helicase DDX42 n=1 Tax=Biomphalaria glabrata TaxID=6526 RepID=A0A9U8DUG2_BIOGL|nr:ATP-dependent RNA helicase DDX42 [Biomphalaria glabrata]XP_013060808.2 ATP-dependent RNA helicase DDX42 [Biomphalaria glabrata]